MQHDITQSRTILQDGGVVLLPTDTAYGLSCRIDAIDAVQRILAIKKRDAAQALIVLASDQMMIEKYLFPISEKVQKEVLNRYWPGMITVILPCRTERVSPLVRGDAQTLAVRVPAITQLRALIRSVGIPLISTSANIHGEATPFHSQDVSSLVKDQVDFVFSHEFAHSNEISTILDCSVVPWRILRQGAVQLAL